MVYDIRNKENIRQLKEEVELLELGLKKKQLQDDLRFGFEMVLRTSNKRWQVGINAKDYEYIRNLKLKDKVIFVGVQRLINGKLGW